MIGSFDIGNDALKMMGKKLKGAPECIVYDGRKCLPTAVYIGEDNTELVGYNALGMRSSSPQRVATNFKEALGTSNEVLLGRKAKELLVPLLRVAKQQMEAQTGETLDGAVFTKTALFTDLQSEDMKWAAQQVGIKVLAIITEPAAAAYAGTIRRNVGNRDVYVGCIDLGSLTLDVTILHVIDGVATPIAIEAIKVGGRDLTAQMEDLLLEKLGKLIGKPVAKDKLSPEHRVELEHRAEQAKIDLGQQKSVRVSLLAGGKTQSVDVTQQEFHKAIEPFVQKILACIDKAFASKGKRPAEMEAVFLSGAPMFSPFLQGAINKHLGVIGKTAGDPSLSVAEGAALHAASLSAGDGRFIPEQILNETTSHDLGVAVIDESGSCKSLVCAVIVPQGTPIPCNRPDNHFRLERDNQTECVFEFYQGADGAAIKDCAPVGSTRLTGLPPEPTRSYRIQIRVIINSTSTAEIIVTDLVSGKSARTSVRLSGVTAVKGAGAP